MNSAFTVHNSEICLPKSTKAGQKKKKKRENANWKNADAANAEPKRSLKLK